MKYDFDKITDRKGTDCLKEHLEENTFHITMIGGGELEEETHRLDLSGERHV